MRRMNAAPQCFKRLLTWLKAVTKMQEGNLPQTDPASEIAYGCRGNRRFGTSPPPCVLVWFQTRMLLIKGYKRPGRDKTETWFRFWAKNNVY